MLFVYSIFALLLATVHCEDQKSYEGWSLIKAYAETDSQVDYLNSLRENESGFELQVWQQGNLKRPFDIFLSPEARDQFLAKLDELDIKYTTASKNVQRALDAEKVPVSPRTRTLANVRNAAWFSKFLRLEEINNAISQLARDYPSLVSIEVIGKSHQGRPINLIKVSSNNGKSKPAIWVDGGIHAREWASPATVLYMLNKLVTGSNSTLKNYVDGATWYFVIVQNPDGYDYTHNGDRMWRKNRRPKQCTRSDCCEGVDLNRNFDYGFGGLGTSPYSCEDTYRGPSGFSEPESQAVRNFVTSHKDIQAFITIHAYSQMWFYPYGDKLNSYPSNVNELRSLAQRGADALRSLYGTEYQVGTAADLLYEAAGGSDDWAKGKANIRYVYCLELRPDGNSFGNGFILPAREIVPVGEETWAGLKVVADAVLGKQ